MSILFRTIFGQNAIAAHFPRKKHGKKFVRENILSDKTIPETVLHKIISYYYSFKCRTGLDQPTGIGVLGGHRLRRFPISSRSISQFPALPVSVNKSEIIAIIVPPVRGHAITERAAYSTSQKEELSIIDGIFVLLDQKG
jgi:hypothetical protein